MTIEFVFTPENLLDNLDKLGHWSCYYLASVALQHYFKEEYNGPDSVMVDREAKMLQELGLECWEDVIVKYQKEVGYEGPFNPDYVNER